MSCESWGPLLAADVYGDNSEAERQRLAGHLATCSACRTQLEGWRAALRRVGPAAAPRDEAFWILQKASILERIPKRTGGRSLAKARWLAPVLATGLMMMTGWNLHQRRVRRDVPIAQNMEMLQNMDMLAHLDVLEAMTPSDVQ